MPRAALFAVVGVLVLVHWLVADPGNGVSEKQSEWIFVLVFSAAVAGLALAVPVFARLTGGAVAFRVSLVPAGGAALSSLANVLEDGLGLGWAFVPFVAGSAVVGAGLVALAAVIAFAAAGGPRLAGAVPAVAAAGLGLYVIAGGILMLLAWLLAAAMALRVSRGAP